MAKVRVLNSSAAGVTLMAYDNAGQLHMATIPPGAGVLPGEAPVESTLLDLLKQKKDRVYQSYLDRGILRIANSNTVEQPQDDSAEPPKTPEVPQVVDTPPVVDNTTPPPAPPAPPAADDDAVPGVTSDTPADAPWATGNK